MDPAREHPSCARFYKLDAIPQVYIKNVPVPTADCMILQPARESVRHTLFFKSHAIMKAKVAGILQMIDQQH